MRRSIVWKCALAIALAQIGHALMLGAITYVTGARPVFNAWSTQAAETLRRHQTLLMDIAEEQGLDAASAAAATLSVFNYQHRIVPLTELEQESTQLGLTGEEWRELAALASEPSKPDAPLRRIRLSAVSADTARSDAGFAVLSAADWPLERVVPSMAVWIGSSLLFSGAAGGLIATWFTRPISRLRRSVARFAAGDLGARPSPRLQSRDDEIGGLANELSRMEDQIAGLVGAQRELLDDVAHELRSPLARMNIAIELAEQASAPVEGAPQSEQSQRMFDRIRGECQQLASMVNRLLELSALEHHVDGTKRVEVSLNRLVGQVAEDCDFEARAADRRVNLRAHQEVRVVANKETLRSAIENVIRNCIRYTPVGRSVDIDISLENSKQQRAQITIRDHGPGVAEDVLLKLFQPFYRAESDRSKDTGGAGLGLALADRAVRAHAGSICARNHHEGGLEFVILLPAFTSSS